MKKLLLAVLVLFGLQTQAQTCDTITNTYLNIGPDTIEVVSNVYDVWPNLFVLHSYDYYDNSGVTFIDTARHAFIPTPDPNVADTFSICSWDDFPLVAPWNCFKCDTFAYHSGQWNMLHQNVQIPSCDSLIISGSQYQITIESNVLVDYWTTGAPTPTCPNVLGEDSSSTIHSVYNYNTTTGLPYDTITTCITYYVNGIYTYCCVEWVWDANMWVRVGTQTTPITNICDSLSYITGSHDSLIVYPFEVWGISNGINNTTDLNWNWTICTNDFCYTTTGPYGAFTQVTYQDTIKLCYEVYAFTTWNNTIDTTICMLCDSLVWNGTEWAKMETVVTSINELTYETINDSKTYDILGREVNEVKIGTMYIRNGKKYIRVR